jgi:hypothetical protein
METLSKRWLAMAVVLLFPALCHAQGLERGNLLGLHVVTVTLNPNVTMDDFTNAFVREVLPEYAIAALHLKS